MGYLHIENLYKNQEVLLFKQVYVLEKIHGTSSHIKWTNTSGITFFAGGGSYEEFIKLFNKNWLEVKFKELFGDATEVIIYGESYGGKQQGMSTTYGNIPKFIAFDVSIQYGEHVQWLNVSNAADVVSKFNIEFVDFALIDCTIENLDREKLKPSVQAIRNGCGDNKKREGIVIRPPIELYKNSGGRIIVKHKNDEFGERKTSQKIVDPAQLEILKDAEKIAEEWVTYNRLLHVLDKVFPNAEPQDISKMTLILNAMIEDIFREAAGEISTEDKNTKSAICKKTAQMFKHKLQQDLTNKT